MNSLSWFLYWADVLPTIAHGMAGISLFGMVLWGLFCVYMFIACDKKWPLIFIPVFLVMMLISGLIPRKDTLYAIAASELGEEALKSNLGKKATQAIEQWIDTQLKPKEQK